MKKIVLILSISLFLFGCRETNKSEKTVISEPITSLDTNTIQLEEMEETQKKVIKGDDKVLSKDKICDICHYKIKEEEKWEEMGEGYYWHIKCFEKQMEEGQ
jgi:hypothetical protein